MCMSLGKISLSVYQNPFYLLLSLQTTINKCIRDSIYNKIRTNKNKEEK